MMGATSGSRAGLSTGGASSASGTLRAVLQDYRAPPSALYAIFPPTRHLSVKVRLFIEFLIERFGLDAG
jgi:DNA-binding transcriptional LysR family regulator